jgi:hypothetical protein
MEHDPQAYTNLPKSVADEEPQFTDVSECPGYLVMDYSGELVYK